jgi:hypothetical protein
MEKSETHRNKWAFGLSVTLSVFIFTSFAFYKGFFSLGNINLFPSHRSSTQVANVISADQVPSPLENAGKTFDAAFNEINQQYQKFTDSVSAVLVPFITGIEVYDRK